MAKFEGCFDVARAAIRLGFVLAFENVGLISQVLFEELILYDCTNR